VGGGGEVRDVSLLQKSPKAVETTQSSIQWVVKQLGEISVELNLHPPHTPSLRAQGLFVILFYSQWPGERSRYIDWATGWTVRDLKPGRSEKRLDWLWGPHRFMFSGDRGSLPGVKWPVNKVLHSPPSSAFMVWTGTNFPFPFTKSSTGTGVAQSVQ
jgi:hypothetical protein